MSVIQDGQVPTRLLYSQAARDHEARLRRLAQDRRSESEVGGIEAAIADVVRDPSINDRPLFDRLVEKVGLGDQPQKRRAFYLKLVKLHQKSAARVEKLIAEVWADALGARSRSRYFCAVLVRRLREEGLTYGALDGGEGDAI